MKYEVAYYEDENGIEQPIFADDLNEDECFQLAKTQELYDVTGQLRLWPREHRDENGLRHFHCRDDANPGRKILGYETSVEHSERITKLIDKLSTNRTWKLLVQQYGADEPAYSFNLSEYLWEPEIHRVVSPNAFIRHDIFGQSRKAAMSIRRPWVAIEVVHTHFPEEETFASFLALSLQWPLVVIFDFTDKENYYLNINFKTETITPIFCIYNGQVLKNAEPIEKIQTHNGFTAYIKKMLSGRLNIK